MYGVLSNRSLIAGGLLLAILCSVSIFPSPALAAPAMPADPPGQNYPLFPPGSTAARDELLPSAYLPLLVNCYTTPAGIYGYVTKAGLPVGGVTIKLIHRIIASTHEEDTKETNACGYFSFVDIPTVAEGSGQGYFARFTNSGIPDCLSQWETRVITPYTINQIVKIGTFDIGDVSMGEPNSDVPLPLPVTFHWTARSQSPSDSYIFYIYDPAHGKHKYTSPPLGYTDNIQIKNSDLPPDMVSGAMYYWYVSILAPDGATGLVSTMHGVAFQIP